MGVTVSVAFRLLVACFTEWRQGPPRAGHPVTRRADTGEVLPRRVQFDLHPCTSRILSTDHYLIRPVLWAGRVRLLQLDTLICTSLDT